MPLDPTKIIDDRDFVKLLKLDLESLYDFSQFTIYNRPIPPIDEVAVKAYLVVIVRYLRPDEISGYLDHVDYIHGEYIKKMKEFI